MATLQNFKTRVRLRIGELTNGTFGIEDYEDDKEVDELKITINEAQISVCRDLFTQQWMPFRRLGTSIPVISGQTFYTLPKDYIQLVDIYHKKEDQPPLPLKPKILSNYRGQDQNAAFDGYFQYYEVSGQVGEILAEGVVTWIDENFQFAADEVSLTHVRIGDIVTNLTDGSQGVITEFGSGIAKLGDGLYGGRSNLMQYGDEFTIQSREETRFNLEVWPEISIEEPALPITEIFNDGLGRFIFSPNADSTIEKINLQLPVTAFVGDLAALQDYDPQDRLLLYIRRIIDEEKHEYEDVDIIGWQNARVGINELNIVESEIDKGHGSIQLYRDELYDAFIATRGFGLIIPDFSAKGLELLQPTKDYLFINYIKRPAELIINESVCELHEELHELVIEKAVLTLLRKKDPKLINGSILQHYKILVEDGKDFLMNLQTPNTMTINTEQMGYSTHTPDYTDIFW